MNQVGADFSRQFLGRTAQIAPDVAVARVAAPREGRRVFWRQ
jgi:hypothetical protein